jgi:drug/metabolite transporter (DMT)-like permease
MSNPLLFLATVMIWGSTWIAINYQINVVDPAVSVAFRFSIAAAILGFWCWFRKLPLRMPLETHKKLILVGILFYTLDYSFLYAAQHHIISALLALLSSSVIYINVVLRRVLLGKPMRLEVVIGATFGLIGIAMIFIPEFEAMSVNEGLTVGLLFAAASFLSAGMGNVVSEKILDVGTPVIQMNFWAMSYSLIFTFGFAFISGASFTLPTVASYYYALLYLALFGSVLAFGTYMKLLQQIGSDKAAYVVLVYPIIVLAISTLFEGYQWTILSAIGVVIVLFGNAVAMGKIALFMRKNAVVNT